jgi:hypothetical protein
MDDTARWFGQHTGSNAALDLDGLGPDRGKWTQRFGHAWHNRAPADDDWRDIIVTTNANSPIGATTPECFFLECTRDAEPDQSVVEAIYSHSPPADGGEVAGAAFGDHVEMAGLALMAGAALVTTPSLWRRLKGDPQSMGSWLTGVGALALTLIILIW